MKVVLRIKPPKFTEKPLVLAEQIVPGVSTYVDTPIVKIYKVPLFVGKVPIEHKVHKVVGYQHEPLRWRKPDPDGKLAPTDK